MPSRTWGKILGLMVILCTIGWMILRSTPPNKPTPAIEIPRPIENFALLDHNGQFHDLYYYANKKAIVLISYDTECSLDQTFIQHLNTLNNRFSEDIVFFMIDANTKDNRKKLQQKSLFWQNKLPILLDETQLISKTLGLSQTSEAIIIDTKNWQAVYQGSIQDKKNIPHLERALQSFLQGNQITQTENLIRGCPIHYNKDALRTKISYVNDVAPILKEKCMPCHIKDGIGPWSMDSYETLRGWAPMMREVIRTKRMPPWHADPNFGTFQNDLSLSKKEFQILIQWLENHTPRDSGDDPLKKEHKRSSQEWTLGEPDMIFYMSTEQELPATGFDEFRFIEADRLVEKSMMIRAIDILPSNQASVHHSNIAVFKDRPEGAADTPHTFSEQDMWVQSENKDNNQVSDMDNMQLLGVLTGYVPGRGPFIFPEDTGALIPEGSKLVFQSHYITTGRKEKDLTKVGFYLHKEMPRNIFVIKTALNKNIKIPSYDKAYEYQASYTLEKDLTLTALQPHMHYRGKSMRFTIIHPDGRKEIPLSVPNYKFNWQRMYTLENPIPLTKGTQIIVDGVFDNSEQNPFNPDPSKEILYGPYSQDEMFVGILFFYDSNAKE